MSIWEKRLYDLIPFIVAYNRKLGPENTSSVTCDNT